MRMIALMLGQFVWMTANATDLAKWKHDGVTQVLTDERGPCIEGASVTRVDGATPRTGCYTLDPKTVSIVWSDASSEQLPIRKFRATREAIARAEQEELERNKQAIKKGIEDMRQAMRPKQPPPQPRPRPRPQGGGGSQP